MTVAQIQTNPTNLDMIDKINEIIRNLLYVDDSTIKISGWGVISAAPPIGTVYVQFPGKSAPADLYGGEWTNISSQFAGMFFRAEGGNAAAFGSSQGGGAPNITGTISGNDAYSDIADLPLSHLSGAFCGTEMSLPVSLNGVDTGTALRTLSIDASRSNAAYNANEFRPYNSTIRIWEKTG